MITGYEALRDDPRLHGLLLTYSKMKKQKPDADWHDRIMEMDGVSEEELNKLHGLLLASGWMETRVHGDAFRTAGKLEACYRITPDGNAALRFSGPLETRPPEPDESEE